jgi:pimeloyl-ACP methyl ester carboxylesterase
MPRINVKVSESAFWEEQLPMPFFREEGSGPGVVCLHANASSSSQWRALMETLAPKFHVLAADSYGAGKSPAWPTDRPVCLRDEVALLEPVFARAGDPFALVAHSYGAAVALVAAVSQPHRIRALALYEPTLFALLDAESPPPNEADGIRGAVAGAAAALDAGDPGGAAECFIDFWMSKGTWAHTPEPRKGPIAASVRNIRGWGRALFTEPTPLAAFSKLNVPVLYMVGSDSPASSRGVERLLRRALPQVNVVEFKGLGHMGPITHPKVVNETIARFLERRV